MILLFVFVTKVISSKNILRLTHFTCPMSPSICVKTTCKIHQNGTEPWKVTLIDTGLKTMTGGRIKRIKDYIGDETFCLTYGDGVTDLDISKINRISQGPQNAGDIDGCAAPGKIWGVQFS